MNILLIDKRVSRYEDIVAAIDPALAVGVVFDYFEDTFDTLKARIEALGLTTINTTVSGTGNSVGLIQHNYRAPRFSMLASADLAPVAQVAAQDPELTGWAQFRDFVVWCNTEFSVAHFDLMACALYSDPDWKYVIDTLSLPGQTGVEIRASTDNTGSAAQGGNWFLESHTGVNLKGTYFTELIEEYVGTLYIYPYNREYSTKGIATGSVITWGNSNYGSNSDAVSEYLGSGVVAVYSNFFAFAALKSDGSVITWGNSTSGGDSSAVSADLVSGVVAVYSTFSAFAALKSDGSVITWGNSTYGGNSSAVSTDLNSGVVSIYSTGYAFAALKSDGSVITWGRSIYGGVSSAVSADLVSGVVAIYSTDGAFAALISTATIFDLSVAYYTDMDRYDILRKKENRRRVNLTTLNNNVFTLSGTRNLQVINPNIPSDKTLRIIVPDYVVSSYSITSAATIPSGAGSVIIACDEGEPVTISGTTYVNFGSYVYKRETDNTYTKLTTAQTISGTSYTMYGGDGINSSGIALISSTPPPRPFFSMRSLYTNNAQVYYKSHSLSTGSGGSGVRNSRQKQRRT